MEKEQRASQPDRAEVDDGLHKPDYMHVPLPRSELDRLGRGHHASIHDSFSSSSSSPSMNSPSTTTSTTSSPYTPLLSFAKRTAQDPLYAYGLSALFWASVPVSFLSAHSDARSSSSPPRLPSSASSSSAASKTPLAKALDAHSFDTVKSQGAKAVSTTPLRGGLAPFWQLAGIGSLIGLGGYITSQGDSLNGAGTVTGESDRDAAL